MGSATCQLCDLEHFTSVILASVLNSIKWDEDAGGGGGGGTT